MFERRFQSNASPHVIARLDRVIQYTMSQLILTNWRCGLPDAPLEAQGCRIWSGTTNEPQSPSSSLAKRGEGDHAKHGGGAS